VKTLKEARKIKRAVLEGKYFDFDVFTFGQSKLADINNVIIRKERR
jgi:hypothetical protein